MRRFGWLDLDREIDGVAFFDLGFLSNFSFQGQEIGSAFVVGKDGCLPYDGSYRHRYPNRTETSLLRFKTLADVIGLLLRDGDEVPR